MTLRIGGRRLRPPVFAATIARDQASWTWKRGVVPDAVLVSYDVLKRWPEARGRRLRATLGFNGPIVVDSGGYGVSAERDPRAVTAFQIAMGAQLAVALDARPSLDISSRQQLAVLRRNAAWLAEAKREARRMRHEAVVHGLTIAQSQYAADKLAAVKPTVYGIPLSQDSARRRFGPALSRVVAIQERLPKGAHVHALGCGSRTLLALLAGVGVELFDSTGYFRRGSRRDKVAPVTMCTFGTPLGKPECVPCQFKQSARTRSVEGCVDFNMTEMLKEQIRVRCALEERAMPQYLALRLGPTRYARFEQLLADVGRVFGRRRGLPGAPSL